MSLSCTTWGLGFSLPKLVRTVLVFVSGNFVPAVTVVVFVLCSTVVSGRLAVTVYLAEAIEDSLVYFIIASGCWLVTVYCADGLWSNAAKSLEGISRALNTHIRPQECMYHDWAV